MVSEKNLVEGCCQGKRAIQKALYNRYASKLLGVCMRYARSVPEAEDILQDGFLKIFDHIKSFRFESKLETWMTRIIINTALNAQRQKLYLLPMVDVNDIPLSQEEEVGLSSFHQEELIRFVQSLPDGCRVIFNLFAIEGYSHKEIAGILNISEGTSKSQYSRARFMLKEKLKSEKGYRRYEESKA